MVDAVSTMTSMAVSKELGRKYRKRQDSCSEPVLESFERAVDTAFSQIIRPELVELSTQESIKSFKFFQVQARAVGPFSCGDKGGLSFYLQGRLKSIKSKTDSLPSLEAPSLQDTGKYFFRVKRDEETGEFVCDKYQPSQWKASLFSEQNRIHAA